MVGNLDWNTPKEVLWDRCPCDEDDTAALMAAASAWKITPMFSKLRLPSAERHQAWYGRCWAKGVKLNVFRDAVEYTVRGGHNFYYKLISVLVLWSILGTCGSSDMWSSHQNIHGWMDSDGCIFVIWRGVSVGESVIGLTRIYILELYFPRENLTQRVVKCRENDRQPPANSR